MHCWKKNAIEQKLGEAQTWTFRRLIKRKIRLCKQIFVVRKMTDIICELFLCIDKFFKAINEILVDNNCLYKKSRRLLIRFELTILCLQE